MPNTNTSTNMGIVVPVVSTDPGPDWAQRIYDALFSTIDAHDHTSGKGAKVPTAGLNINADLAFGGYNATGLRSLRLNSQAAPLALGSDIGCLYEVNGELYYNDSAANKVQLTQSGAVKSAPQSLSFKSVTTSYTILSSDGYQLLYCHSETAATAIALPSSALVAPGRTYWLYDVGQNAATNNLTIAPNGTDTINGVNAATTVAINGHLAILTTDGAGKWSLNVLGPQPLGATTATQALTTGAVTLTAAQVAARVVQFTGTLTGNVTITVPNTMGYYLFDFSAVVMGAFTVAVKSGTTTSATMAAANVGSTQTLAQLTSVVTYGGNTVRVKV